MKLTKQTYQRLMAMAFYIPIYPGPTNSSATATISINWTSQDANISFPPLNLPNLEFSIQDIQIFILLRGIYLNFCDIVLAVYHEDKDFLLNKKGEPMSNISELAKKLRKQPRFPLADLVRISEDAFQSFHECAEFYYNFQEVENVYKLSERIQPWIKKYPFFNDILIPLASVFSSSRRNISLDLSIAISHLSDLLAKPPNGSETLESVKEILSECMDVYMGSYETIGKKVYRVANEAELTRRRKITDTKRKQNEKRRTAVTKIIEKIQRQINGDRTAKAVCRKFWESNRDKLAPLKISSPRTLENLLSNLNEIGASNRRRKEEHELVSGKSISEEKLLLWATERIPKR